jgi:hypothetical protein
MRLSRYGFQEARSKMEYQRDNGIEVPSDRWAQLEAREAELDAKCTRISDAQICTPCSGGSLTQLTFRR